MRIGNLKIPAVKDLSIGTKLILGFTVVVVTSSLFIGYFSRQAFEKSLKEHLFDELVFVAEAKEGHLLEFLEHVKIRAVDFSSDGFIRKSVKTLSSEGKTQKVISDLSNHLIKNKITLDKTIFGINIINADGEVIASTSDEEIGMIETEDIYFIEAKKLRSGEAFISDVEPSHHFGTKENSFTAVAPIIEKETGKLIGVVANYVKLSELNSVLSGVRQIRLGSLSGLRSRPKTLDVYIVNKDGFMITESVFLEDVIFNQKIDSPLVRECRFGKEIVSSHLNYRGVPVIGASMCLPNGWTLVAEIDKSEAFASLDILKKNIVFGTIVFFLIALLLLYIIVGKSTESVKKMTMAAEKISRGDLSQKLEVSSKDELGRLAAAFNEMALKLEESYKTLEENLEKYKVLVETSPDCVKLFDTEGNVVFINKGGLEEHRLKRFEDIKTWDYIGGVVEEDREKFKTALHDAAEKGKTSTIEIRHTKEGSKREICLETISPVKDSAGKIIGIFGVSRDISKLKKLEGDLEKRISELERFNKLTVNRELKMVELKKEIKKLKKEIEKYKK